MKDDLTLTEVSAMLRYEPISGKLYWIERAPDAFATEAACRSWNCRFAGKEAASRNWKGYLVVNIKNNIYRAHRMGWLLHYGEWPSSQIDHINGDKADNRIANLRAVTNAENHRNMPLRSDNTSGHVGVHYIKRTGRYQAKIKVNGRPINLGFFGNIEDAIAARRQAETEHRFRIENR